MSGSRSAFAVVLMSANAEIERRIGKAYPEHYRLTDTFFLVRDNVIAERVAIAVGLKGDDRIEDASGAVFRLDGFYSGFAPPALWDWLTLEVS